MRSTTRPRLLPIALLAAVALAAFGSALAVPGFSRQTGQSCSACHTQFPELNSFGRQFKLGGYTMTGAQAIEEKTAKGKEVLSLPQIPGISFMILTSYARTQKDLPSPAGPPAGPTQNHDVLFPDQLSLFLAGGISPKLGAFIQVTYDSQSGSVGWDNADIRFAGGDGTGPSKMAWGLTLNNSPTVQDLWNSTPVWGFPWASSGAAPAPTAATLLEGGLAQQVAGLGGYFMWNDFLYGEMSLYRSAPQGVERPLDATAASVIDGLTPYWRLAVQRERGKHYLSGGTFGIAAKIFPGDGAFLEGPADRYNDFGLDLQYQFTKKEGGFSAHATWIREKQDLYASLALGDAQNRSNTLVTVKLDGIYRFGQRYAASLGWFSITGDSDTDLYASRNGSPDTDGLVAGFDFMPWQNTRLSLQYTAYSRFDGNGENYDGAGRNASDNNTVSVLAWLVF